MFIKLTDKDKAPIYLNKNTIISMVEEKDTMNCDTENTLNGFNIIIKGTFDATKLTCGVNGVRQNYYVLESIEQINSMV